MIQMLDKADNLARNIWSREQTCFAKKLGLLRQLIRASHEDRNLRVSPNYTPYTTADGVESETSKCHLVCT
jgi:hypothetical protein